LAPILQSGDSAYLAFHFVKMLMANHNQQMKESAANETKRVRNRYQSSHVLGSSDKSSGFEAIARVNFGFCPPGKGLNLRFAVCRLDRYFQRVLKIVPFCTWDIENSKRLGFCIKGPGNR